MRSPQKSRRLEQDSETFASVLQILRFHRIFGCDDVRRVMAMGHEVSLILVNKYYIVYHGR